MFDAFYTQMKAADEAHFASMRAGASGRFAEYLEEQRREAAKRLGIDDEPEPNTNGEGSGANSGGAAGSIVGSESSGAGRSPEDAPRAREESA